MSREFYTKANDLNQQGIPYATATVVRIEKPTSGKPGDKAIITVDGKLYGWIGGSCAQPTVIREAQIAMRDGISRFIRLSSDNDPANVRDGLMVFPMTCYSEGSLEIFIEPHLPQPQLIVIGSMPVAQALIRIGNVMDYHVLAVDPENTGTDLSSAEKVLDNLGAVLEHVRPESYVVVASHGNYDEAALEHVLQSKPCYIGLVASKKRFASVVEYLKHQGMNDEDLTPLKAPAGIDIHAKRADEIALSIMAEIVQIRRSRPISIDWNAIISDIEDVVIDTETQVSHTATDPVCGMEVDIKSAQYTFDYEGETYYFCCAGCKLTFSKTPEQYIHNTPSVAIDPVCHMEVNIVTAQYISEYEDDVYYFCCAGCKMSFEKDPQTYLQSATDA